MSFDVLWVWKEARRLTFEQTNSRRHMIPAGYGVRGALEKWEKASSSTVVDVKGERNTKTNDHSLLFLSCNPSLFSQPLITCV